MLKEKTMCEFGYKSSFSIFAVKQLPESGSTPKPETSHLFLVWLRHPIGGPCFGHGVTSETKVPPPAPQGQPLPCWPGWGAVGGAVDTSHSPCEAWQAHTGPCREQFAPAPCRVLFSCCRHIAIAISRVGATAHPTA